MSCAHDLHGFSLAAVRSSPDLPALLISDGIAGIPKLWSHACVGAVSKKTRSLSFLDLVSELRTELEVETHVIDAPGPVRLHIDAVIGVGDDVLRVPCSRLQRNVGHADKRDAVPAVSAHAAVALQTKLRSRFPAHQISDKFSILDQRRAGGRNAFVVPTKSAKTRGTDTVGREVHDRRSVPKT